MRIPLQITFKECVSSPALEEVIRERAAALESHFPQLTSCRALVEAPHAHHRKHANSHIRIEVTIPGRDIVATEDVAHHPGQGDVAAGIRQAFHAIARQLQDGLDRERHSPSRERISGVAKA